MAVVGLELILIAWIRHRCMNAPLLQAALQVILGGRIVFAAGLLIGGS